jgi:predicted RND superfamily exporter protein
MVDSVDEIATYIPPDATEKQPIIQRIHDRLAAAQLGDCPSFCTNKNGTVPFAAPIPVVPRAQLNLALEKLQGVMLAQRRPEAAQLQQIRGLIAALPEQEYYNRLSAFQQRLAADTLQCLYALRTVSNPQPPVMTDLPEGVVGRLVGKSGYYCMQIHTKADIWNMAEMEQFVGQLRAVDDRLHAEHPAIDTGVTGNPVQVFESSRELMWGYEKGALYGVIIVVVIVYLDFRSIRMTLLALLPLVTSKVQLFGLMGWLGIPLNPANMIVLPLILGIGVDTGVQIVHDYLREPRPYRMPASTSAALVINTLMNIVGFGALMIASHRGLHSLGRVLTLGMACCLLSCLVMPSLLQILPEMRPQSRDEEPVPRKVQDSGIELADESIIPQGQIIHRRAA